MTDTRSLPQAVLTDAEIKTIVGAGDSYWATSKVFIVAIARAIESAILSRMGGESVPTDDEIWEASRFQVERQCFVSGVRWLQNRLAAAPTAPAQQAAPSMWTGSRAGIESYGALEHEGRFDAEQACSCEQGCNGCDDCTDYGDTPGQQAADVQGKRNREADRARFPDPEFNHWLDDIISDSGHTVWDQVGDVCAAWHGWDNRQYFAGPAAAQSVPKDCPDGHGAMTPSVHGLRCDHCGFAIAASAPTVGGAGIDRLRDAMKRSNFRTDYPDVEDLLKSAANIIYEDHLVREGRAALDAKKAAQEPSAAAEPVARDWAALYTRINSYIEDYEYDDGESRGHDPSEFERFVMVDAIMGLLSEDWFTAFYAAPPTPPSAPAGAGEGEQVRHEGDQDVTTHDLLDESATMLEDYALHQRDLGNDSTAAGANAHAYRLRHLTVAAPPSHEGEDARDASARFVKVGGVISPDRKIVAHPAGGFEREGFAHWMVHWDELYVRAARAGGSQ